MTDDRTTEFDAIRVRAAAAAQAWAVATGLAATVTDFRRRQDDVEARPVPGLAELVDRITDDFTDLSALLDVALSAAEAPVDDDPDVRARRLERARVLHARIGATTRRLPGVSRPGRARRPGPGPRRRGRSAPGCRSRPPWPPSGRCGPP